MIDYTPSDEIKQLAEEQRREQRNVRRVSIPGSNQSSGSTSDETRSTSQDARGHTTGASGNSEAHGSSDRSVKKRNIRGRQDYGRLVSDSTSTSEGNNSITKPIGFEPIDAPITTKHTPKLEIPKIFATKKKQPLSSAEVEALQDTLPACLQSYGENVDKIIHYKSKVEEGGDIWGDLSTDEARVIARILIKRGAKSGHAADFIRQMVNGEDYVAAGLVVVPRVIKTVEELRLAPNAKRVKR